MATKKVLYRTEITPRNLRSMFNLIAIFYNRVVKSNRGKIKFSVSKDDKGYGLYLRIPTVHFSKPMNSILSIIVDKYIAKDTYLNQDEELQDEEI